MTLAFQRIGLIGKHRSEAIAQTVLALKTLLRTLPVSVVVEAETAATLPADNLPVAAKETLHQHCDAVIVVGGDGSFLTAARAVVEQQLPMLGINRGKLGFLTDIRPDELAAKVSAVLAGHFREETRFLLTAAIYHQQQLLHQQMGLNDVVLMPGNVAHMIEFEIYVDQQFVCSERADGLIIATPTGSTAYALSGGGPILHPQLDAIVLVPMFPHTLSSRPIVIDGNSEICLHIPADNETAPRISCDGQERLAIPPGGKVIIRKKPEQLRLIHPLDYNYFETLRDKLHWGKKLT